MFAVDYNAHGRSSYKPSTADAQAAMSTAIKVGGQIDTLSASVSTLTSTVETLVQGHASSQRNFSSHVQGQMACNQIMVRSFTGVTTAMSTSQMAMSQRMLASTEHAEADRAFERAFDRYNTAHQIARRSEHARAPHASLARRRQRSQGEE